MRKLGNAAGQLRNSILQYRKLVDLQLSTIPAEANHNTHARRRCGPNGSAGAGAEHETCAPVMEARRRGRPRRPSGQGFDRYVGGRIRERRMAFGLTQQELADRLGITCQQLQRYENGGNQIAAGRLYMIARALDTNVGSFFVGLKEPEKAPFVAPAPGHVAGQVAPRAKEDALAALLRALGLPVAEAARPPGSADRDPAGYDEAPASDHESVV